MTVDVSLKQIVKKVTRGTKILTVVLTDLERFYLAPVVVPPIGVDDPLKDGVPSDHDGVLVSPSTVFQPRLTPKISRTVRPINNSCIEKLGSVLVNEQWHFMDPSLAPTELTALY